MKEAGYEVVINLATGTTPRDLANEKELLAAQGLEYMHIPVIWEHPTAENFQDFFAAMEAHHEEQCFVHCIATMRVSTFVFLYRVLRQGVPMDEARATMNKLWEPNQTWQSFIDEAMVRSA